MAIKPKTVAELLPEITLAESVAQLYVNHMTLDSRKVQKGSIFVALKGIKTDGVAFIKEAIKQGAVLVLVDQTREDLLPEYTKNIAIVAVPELQAQLGHIAARLYDHPSGQAQVVGVTGTNGKSTIVSVLAQMHHLLGKKSATMGTIGYGVVGETLTETGMTTPDAIQCQQILGSLVNQDVTLLAMEVSSHGIALHRVEGMDYNVAILTNITRDHLDFHRTFDQYATVKKDFILGENVAQAVLNWDDASCQSCWSDLNNQGKKSYRYSVNNSQADVYASDIEYTREGIQATLHTPWGEGRIDSVLVGEFNLSNLLAAITTSLCLGETLSEVLAQVPSVLGVAGRMEQVRLGEKDLPIQVYIDYAHTPDALERALAVLKNQPHHKLWVVFGCGGDRDKGKRPLMANVAQQYSDYVIVTSDNPRTENPDSIVAETLAPIQKQAGVRGIVDRAQAIDFALRNASPNDVVLIAGKGHEDYQIIGQTKTPFSDYKQAHASLEDRWNKTGATP